MESDSLEQLRNQMVEAGCVKGMDDLGCVNNEEVSGYAIELIATFFDDHVNSRDLLDYAGTFSF